LTSTATATVEVAEGPELRFDAGLPGFPAATRFALVRWGGDSSPFSLLQSLDDEALAFVVVPPEIFFPTYTPEIDDLTIERLGVTRAEDVLLLVIITLGASPADATANLLGPIVINTVTSHAAQAVLQGQPWTSRTPLHTSQQ
jgi:flagellar assembly factor FliW